jgi:F420H(2)-dependent biliverdin reductase
MTDRLRLDRNLWLATTRPDGRPHVVPIWFVYVDDRFWVATGATSVKVRNIANQSGVTAALEDGNAPVVAEGAARIHPRPYPDSVVAAFAQKYDWDITVAEDDDLGEIVLCEVRVSRWLFGGP